MITPQRPTKRVDCERCRKNAGAQQNQGFRPTKPLHDTPSRRPSTMTTPLHSTLCCKPTRLNSRDALTGGRFRPATPLHNTSSQHPFGDDDTPSRQPSEVDIPTPHVARAFQSGEHETSPNAIFSLCEVNRQTPISKRGGVRVAFLNMCREADEGCVSEVSKHQRAVRGRRSESGRIKSLGLDAMVGALAQRKFAGWRKRPGLRGSKSHARERTTGTAAWINRRIECRVSNRLADLLRIEVCTQRCENRLRETAGGDESLGWQICERKGRV